MGQHGADGVERLLRPAFLDEPNACVDDDDREDDDGVESVAQEDGDERRGEQHIDEKVVELGEHARDERARLSSRQAVRPLRLEPLCGLLGGQSLGRGLAELERGLGRLGVPGTFSRGGQILHPAIEFALRLAIADRARSWLAAPSGQPATAAISFAPRPLASARANAFTAPEIMSAGAPRASASAVA